MSYLLNNQQKLNEVIFAERNKAYGAYVLRSNYGATLFKSLSLVMLSVSSMAITAYLYFHQPENGPSAAGQLILHDSVYVIPFNAQKEEEKKLPESKTNPPTKPAGAAPEENHGKPVVSDTAAVDHSSVVTSTVAATTSSYTGTDTGTTSTTNTGSGTNTLVPPKDPVEGFAVDSPPEFEGGLPALYRFIKDNLRYPAQAYETGADGTVFVRFVVDESGKVGRLSLLNSKGFGLDEEALRVVGMIPKFKTPAKVNGQAVKVYYQLPIRFRIAH